MYVLNLSNQQGRDCQRHGTHVAALAAGKTFDAAKGATIYSTRVIPCSGRGGLCSYNNGSESYHPTTARKKRKENHHQYVTKRSNK